MRGFLSAKTCKLITALLCGFSKVLTPGMINGREACHSKHTCVLSVTSFCRHRRDNLALAFAHNACAIRYATRQTHLLHTILSVCLPAGYYCISSAKTREAAFIIASLNAHIAFCGHCVFSNNTNATALFHFSLRSIFRETHHRAAAGRS